MAVVKMNYAVEWNEAHRERLMIANEPDHRLVEFAKPFNDSTEDKSRYRWLDIGCGTGRSAEWLSACGFKVSAFDSSVNAIIRAYDRMTAKRQTLPTFVIADVTKPWPYSPDSFDAAVDIRSLENLTSDELQFAWAQTFRVLKRGGKFLSICASPKRDDSLTTVGVVTKLNPTDLAGLIRESGFRAHCSSQKVVLENSRVIHDWQVVATKP